MGIKWPLTASLFCLLTTPFAAFAADFEEYTRRVQAAETAHSALVDASAEHLPSLREHALERDLAVIEWLDEFLASDEFATLPDEQKTLARQDRYRNEYNASRLLIDLDRCGEARDRVRSLLDSGVRDDELQPRLTTAYEEAIACLNRARVATVRFEVMPSDARVYLDGAFAGLATGQYDVDLGEHTVLLEADGYLREEHSFTARTEGQEVVVGPVELAVQVQVEPTSSGPQWYDWTLLAVGGVGVGTGVALLLAASGRQDDIDNPPSGQVVEDESAEQDIVDSYRMGGFVALGVGGAAAIAGTLSILLGGGGDDDESVTWNGGIDPVGRSLWLQFRF